MQSCGDVVFFALAILNEAVGFFETAAGSLVPVESVNFGKKMQKGG